MNKKILGIDPGFISAGYAIIENSKNKNLLIDLGCLQQKSSESISNRVGKFFDFFLNLIEINNIEIVVLEAPFLGKNPSSFLKLGYLRGIVNLICYQKKLSLIELSPREVKQNATGYGNADKEQVASAMRIFFPQLKKYDKITQDATDALALAFSSTFQTRKLL